MLRRVLCTPFRQQFQHCGLDRFGVAVGFDDVVLVEHVAQEMPVIEPVAQVLVDLIGQFLKPSIIVAAQRDIQREDILNRAGVYGGVAGCGTCGGKPV